MITCRSGVYDAIRELCNDAGLQSGDRHPAALSAEDIYIYLEQYRDEHRQAEAKWAPVTDQLERTPDGILATALGTPWLVSLAATALTRGGHETGAKLAACGDTAQIRELLFATRIPAAVDATPDTKHTRNYTEENVAVWLCTLAEHLEQRRTEHSGGSQVALDQIWQLAGTRECRALHAVLGALTWVATGLAVTISIGVLRRDNMVVATLLGLVGGIAAILTGLWYGLAPVRADIGLQRSRPSRRFAWRGSGVPKRFAWRVPGRSRWRRGVKRGIIVGLLVSVGPWLVFVLHGLSPAVLAWYLALAFALALVFGLVRGLGTTAEERLALGQDAGRIVHDDRVSALVGGLIWFAISATFLLPLLLQNAINNDYRSETVTFRLKPDNPYLLGNAYRDPFLVGTQIEPDGTTLFTRLEPVHLSAVAALKDWNSWLPGVLIACFGLGLLLALLFASLSAVASGRYAIASLLFGFTWALSAPACSVSGVGA